VDPPGSGYGSLAGCCECGDDLSGSGVTELVNYIVVTKKRLYKMSSSAIR
jgi:hypothetical protein